MTVADFLSELNELLELEPGTVTSDTNLKELEEWDSMAALSFIAFADEKLGQKVSGAKLAEVETTQDLIALLGDSIQA